MSQEKTEYLLIGIIIGVLIMTVISLADGPSGINRKKKEMYLRSNEEIRKELIELEKDIKRYHEKYGYGK